MHTADFLTLWVLLHLLTEAERSAAAFLYRNRWVCSTNTAHQFGSTVIVLVPHKAVCVLPGASALFSAATLTLCRTGVAVSWCIICCALGSGWTACWCEAKQHIGGVYCAASTCDCCCVHNTGHCIHLSIWKSFRAVHDNCRRLTCNSISPSISKSGNQWMNHWTNLSIICQSFQNEWINQPVT